MRKTKIKNIEKFIIIFISFCILVIMFALHYMNLSALLGYDKYAHLVGGIDENGKINDYSGVYTFLSIHFTTVFLVTSLMTMLGSREDYVYYEDIMQTALLEPIIVNFRGLAAYAYTTLISSVIFFCLKDYFLVAISAILGCVLVTILFFKMVNVFFNRSGIKKRIFRKTKSRTQKWLFEKRIRLLFSRLESNMNPACPDIARFSENITFLFKLYAYYTQKEDDSKVFKIDKMIDNCFLKNEKNKCFSFMQVYVNVFEELCNEKNEYAIITLFQKLNLYDTEKVVDIRDDLEINIFYDINLASKMEDQLKPMSDKLCKELEKRKEEKNYYICTNLETDDSKFIQLAKQLFWITVYPNFPKCKLGAEEHGSREFYPEIKTILEYDIERFESPTMDNTCLENLAWSEYYLIENEEYKRMEYMAEFGIDERRKNAYFVSILPELLPKNMEKPDKYNEKTNVSIVDKFISGLEEMFSIKKSIGENGYNTSKTYQFMMDSFFGGFAYLFMRGKCEEYINVVAKQIESYWSKTIDKLSGQYQVQDRDKEINTFLDCSFSRIIPRLLYADTSYGNKHYNENPEVAVLFWETLVAKIRNNKKLDNYFEEYIKKMDKYVDDLTPKFYKKDVFKV